MADEVLYEVSGPVARLTINRPERRNALAPATLGGLRGALAEARGDAAVRVVVLAGAGERAFCSGVDLADAGRSGFLGDHDGRAELGRLFEDLWSLGKPTVAAVRGFALAGGFGLALSCDLVLAAQDAVFGAPEIGVGLWPFMISVPLTRAMPPKKALELMMTGRRVGAVEALEIGFVNRVVPVGQLEDAVAALAAELGAASPLIMRLGRDSFYATRDLDAGAALRYLQAQLSLAAATEDAAEGMAAFREKRPPRWRGR